MRVVAAAVLAGSLLVGCGKPPAPRNVLLIVVDTLRADHLGVYGYERPTSPNLDRLAASGVVFTRAFSSSSWTVPAVASMLTGLPPSAHGGGFEVEGPNNPWNRTAIDEGVVTLAQRLRRRGFRTIGYVRNPFLSRGSGFDRGFERYHMYKSRQRADHAIDAALSWIDRRGDEPFFMLLHFMEPHAPYAPLEPFAGYFTGEEKLRKLEPLKVRRARRAEYTESDRQYFIDRYDEEIVGLDDRLGRLFAGLGERWKDTLIIFTSDHGEELLDHGSFDHGHTMMQELLHVPLLLWAPGLEPRRVDAPVSLSDVTPTVVEALGLPRRKVAIPGSGRSIWGLARGEGGGSDRALLAEGRLWGSDQKTLIRWPYKLVLDPGSGSRRLTNLVADPSESIDLAGEFPDLADEMEGTLREALVATGMRRGSRADEVDPETQRDLEALGYVN